HGIIQSMSRKGNCLDNSPTENFFGRLKTEIFYDNEFKYESIDQLKREIDKYIKYYNEERINVKRKGLSLLNYRHQSLLLFFQFFGVYYIMHLFLSNQKIFISCFYFD
ncbi:MAG: IS3 family transposase, partial [Erysipelotrichales bacterium]|nr:IS3 family transposase [Erysipelotrichales bacterium]